MYRFGGSLNPGGNGNITVNTSQNFKFTVSVAGTGSLLISTAGGVPSDSSIVVTSASCIAANLASTTKDSQNLSALQDMIAPIIAQTSGQAITGAIGDAVGDAFANGANPITASGNGLHFNFAANTPRDSRIEEPFNALGYAANGGIATKAPRLSPLVERDWSLWADVRGTGWRGGDPNSDIKGTQANVTAGLGRKLATDFLIGILTGYERFKYDVASLTGALSGTGGTVGTYAAWHINGQLRVDAALAWSDIKYDASAGTAAGSFRGSRWLYSAGLTGTYGLGAVALEPSAKVFLLNEREGAWTNNLGITQDAHVFTVGRASNGAKVLRSFVYAPNAMLTPYVGLFGDYRFSTNNALPVVGIKDGLSGRLTSGATITDARGMTLAVGGEVGGLGANYKVWTGNARVNWPF